MEEFQRLKGQLDEAKGTEEILNVMKRLSGMNVSVEILKVTQIGKVVNKLRKHADNRVASIANTILTDWKSSVTPSSPSLSSSTSSLSSSSSSVEKSTKPAAAKLKVAEKLESQQSIKNEEKEKEKEKEKEDEEEAQSSDEDSDDDDDDKAPSKKKRKVSSSTVESNKRKKIDPPFVKKNGKTNPAGGENGIRDTVRALLMESLAPKEDDGDLDPMEAASQIEEVLYSIFKSANKDYKAKYRSLSFNLKNKKNPFLRRAVLTGDISIEKLCQMSAHEMASPEEQAKRKEIEKYHLEASKLDKLEATTDQFLCGKCKNRKCSYYQLQTRSADEPMTVFITCTVCNNRWKK